MFKAVLVLLLLPALAFAHPCPDKPKVQVKSHTRSYPKKAAPVVKEYPAWQKLKDGFALTAGFRWDKECPDCPPVSCVPTRRGHHDPAFVGAELRLPLDTRFTAFGNFDRDLVDGPDWNARIGLAYRPFK